MPFSRHLLLPLLLSFTGIGRAQSDIQYPVLFATQVPQPGDFTTIGSVFGNQSGSLDSAPRGGDLWIRYPDGSTKNLTATAGYGTAGQQGNTAIAVRQPAVHWSGTKAVFSMVTGAPAARYQIKSFYWQMYEITGLGKNETPVITPVAGQPANYNNVSPIYAPDDSIIFTSDRPRDGQAHLYPQLDEYEEAATVSGLWSLNPARNSFKLLQHAPSGAFTPIVDSFGRVIFTRWDHLQRDQQADADISDVAAQRALSYGTFNYASEAPGAQAHYNVRTELFPETRADAGTVNGHRFNQFFPWQINPDGTEEETLNHVGRQELGGYMTQNFTNDPNLKDFYNFAVTNNPNRIFSFLHIREDPLHPGRFYGINAPEFGTHSGGQVVSMEGAPTVNPDNFYVTLHTPQSTASATTGTPPADHSGLYRNPLPLSDGQLLAVHTSETRADVYQTSPWQSRYAFRIKKLVKSGNYYVPGTPLTSGLSKSVTWWDPDNSRTYSGELWELDPVEVRPRPRPVATKPHLPDIEAGVFAGESVHVPALKEYLKSQNLALVVSRDVTTRDRADKQQPFNLRVNTTTGLGVQTTGAGGTVYDVRSMQFFQGDLIRGIGMRQATDTPRQGRRVIAQAMHDTATMAIQPPNPSGPAGSVKLGSDGSMAAFVPAQRALTWQMTSPAGDAVVRERYWLTFQPGEIRTCTSCHGVNTKDQANHGAPTNAPEALKTLLQHWKTSTGLGAAPKAAWKQLKFGGDSGNAAISGDAADPDRDGVNNLLEYAFNSDPLTAAAASALPTPSVTMVDGRPVLGITFRRSLTATDLRYQVEFSSDQINWTPGNVYAYDDELTSTAGTIETARSGSPVQTITVQRTGPMANREFFRLRVSGL